MRIVTASDFHDIVVRRDAGKAERLMRASVSAFCSLTRPSRREALQLDDLTLPLFEMVSIDARRFVAAALSECGVVPPELHARLADQPVEISAPLLVRSAHLRDIDLIALIGRHGLGHARAIARRKKLEPAIAQLIRAMEAAASATAAAGAAEPAPSDPPVTQTPGVQTPPDAGHAAGGDAAEATRERLRAIMKAGQPAPTQASKTAEADFARLRDAALTGEAQFLATALAETLKVNVATARAIPSTGGLSSLIAAFRALDFSEERAFLLVAAILPGQFSHPEAVRLFLERYRALDAETARERVRGWKLEMVANWIQWQSANTRGRPPRHQLRHAGGALGRLTPS
jgi:uncharacterized protein (DUF2336 family)